MRPAAPTSRSTCFGRRQLTVSRPDLGEAIKVYLAQQAVLKQELTLLDDTPRRRWIERLHAMAAEKAVCDRADGTSLPDYRPRPPTVRQWKASRPKKFARLLSGTLAAILLLLVAVHA